jgi:hypothetical protein
LVRQKEPFDKPAEPLFRALNAETHCDGDAVLPDGMDADGTSCSRGRFCDTAQEALDRSGRADHDAVASVPVEGIPKGVHTTPGGSQWEFYPEDLPEEANDAHCEIRFRHPGQPGPDRVKRSARDLVRQTLARTFRVVYRKA